MAVICASSDRYTQHARFGVADLEGWLKQYIASAVSDRPKPFPNPYKFHFGKSVLYGPLHSFLQ